MLFNYVCIRKNWFKDELFFYKHTSFYLRFIFVYILYEHAITTCYCSFNNYSLAKTKSSHKFEIITFVVLFNNLFF